MSRDALVVGINFYDCEQLSNLKASAEDAEAIAQRLTQSGNFRVKRLPEVIDPTTQAVRIGRKTKVTLAQLEEALVQLFKPTGSHIPDTGLFYFSGHGLRKDRGIQEGFLATSDTDPITNQWGLRLKWLRELLQESPIRQQIVWLDCCYSGELLNFNERLEEADPGSLEQHDRCFIAASREYEVAYEETAGSHGVLTGALLQALDPQQRSDGLVTNFTLTEAVSQALKSVSQRPLFANFGNKIILTGQAIEPALEPAEGGICPYRGLAYFDSTDEDARFFYGRTALTDVLLERVRDHSFLAVIGPSGSGKSSVVRAGLLHQLKVGQRISGSDAWQVYIIRPGDNPSQSLAEAFIAPGLSVVDRAEQFRKAQELIDSGANGMIQLITACQSDRVLLVIDQFEECFTLCRDEAKRQQFFESLMGAVQQLDKKLGIVITLRADFFNKCLQYPKLAKQIENNLVAVKPMSRDELVQAITEPARQVNLEIEAELVTQMILDVESSPGSLPLLQYTLTELWKRRSVNWLTLAAYNRIGGIRGTLQQRAEEVYGSLSPPEQETARRIFLELTQLGEGTEDTRRQVLKRDLITANQSESIVDRVIQRLSTERLVVTSELIERSGGDRVQVIDVAHEALIRHWPRLRQWIEDNRSALRKKREIEEAATIWLESGKPTELAYLLLGSKLLEAQEFIRQNDNRLLLSSTALEFIGVSQQQERYRRLVRWGTILSFPLLVFLFLGGYGFQQQQSSQRLQRVIQGLFLSHDPDTIASALPQSFTTAAQLEKNPTPQKIDLALSYYRQIMIATSKDLQNQVFSQAHRQAEDRMADLIDKYRLGDLKTYLANSQFGEPIPNANIALLEKQFTEGALQATYKILMLDYGVGADLNRDGHLSEDEATLIPCKTLARIEELWKKERSTCSWNNDTCIEMRIGNSSNFASQSLATAIFDPNGVEYAINRIQECHSTMNSPSN